MNLRISHYVVHKLNRQLSCRYFEAEDMTEMRKISKLYQFGEIEEHNLKLGRELKRVSGKLTKSDLSICGMFSKHLNIFL